LGYTDTYTNFLFGEDHKQLRYEECMLAQEALIQQTARIGTRYGHKNLQELARNKTAGRNKHLSNESEDR
jgi:hypothetical protein